MYCTQCGQLNKDDARLCRVCGKGLSSQTPLGSAPDSHDMSGGSTMPPGGPPPRSPTPVTFSGVKTLTGPGTGNRPGGKPEPPENQGLLKSGNLVVGRFEVVAVLGQGGMGQVFKVRDTTLDTLRAMKVIRPELLRRSDVVERFREEVRICQKLSHPNIVHVYEYDMDRGRSLHFFTMEYVDGLTLRDWLKQKKAQNNPVSVEEFRRIARETLLALVHAHEVTIHRDLKPENIILEGKTGKAKLMDFGIARAIGRPKPLVTAGSVGTIHYMAPEQERGEKVDHRVDIYSAGVMFYEILTGEVPRAGSKPPIELRPEVGQTINDAILKAMATSQDERFRTSAQMYQALLKAPRPTPPPEPGHTGWRYTKSAWAIAGLVIVLILGYVFKGRPSAPVAVTVPQAQAPLKPWQPVNPSPGSRERPAIPQEAPKPKEPEKIDVPIRNRHAATPGGQTSSEGGFNTRSPGESLAPKPELYLPRLAGRVTAMLTDRVTVDLGRRDGIGVGTILAAELSQYPIISNGQTLGHREAELRVTAIEDAQCHAVRVHSSDSAPRVGDSVKVKVRNQ